MAGTGNLGTGRGKASSALDLLGAQVAEAAGEHPPTTPEPLDPDPVADLAAEPDDPDADDDEAAVLDADDVLLAVEDDEDDDEAASLDPPPPPTPSLLSRIGRKAGEVATGVLTEIVAQARAQAAPPDDDTAAVLDAAPEPGASFPSPFFDPFAADRAEDEDEDEDQEEDDDAAEVDLAPDLPPPPPAAPKPRSAKALLEAETGADLSIDLPPPPPRPAPVPAPSRRGHRGADPVQPPAAEATSGFNPFPRPPIYDLVKDAHRFGVSAADARKIRGNCFRGRPAGIQAIVLHIQEGTTSSSLNWWANGPGVQASSSVMIQKDGSILRVVTDDNGPWTNGDVAEPSAKGRRLINRFPHLNPNQVTVSVEAEGYWQEAHPFSQIQGICWMCAEWMNRHGLRIDDIYRHADFNSVSRPNCPGTYFPQVIEALAAAAREHGLPWL